MIIDIFINNCSSYGVRFRKLIINLKLLKASCTTSLKLKFQKAYLLISSQLTSEQSSKDELYDVYNTFEHLCNPYLTLSVF